MNAADAATHVAKHHGCSASDVRVLSVTEQVIQHALKVIETTIVFEISSGGYTASGNHRFEEISPGWRVSNSYINRFKAAFSSIPGSQLIAIF